jgi:hypothetical protein
MSTSKPAPGDGAKKKAEVSLVRSSAAEYLTFVAASGQGGVEAVYADENVWLSQKMMGLLYDVETHTINYHLKKVFDDSELEAGSVIRNFRITAADGKTYDTQHYNLSAIIAVGYKVNSERAVQFRKWATGIIESFTIKGYAMDDERLKNDGSILGKKYFEEQLQRILGIRLSERKFYQKITDIYATSIDYDVRVRLRPDDQETAGAEGSQTADNMSAPFDTRNSAFGISPARRLAVMNLALRGIEADYGPPAPAGPNTFRRDLPFQTHRMPVAPAGRFIRSTTLQIS